MDESKRYIRNTFAKSTQASYRSHLKAYLRFCLYFDFVPVPATQQCLVCYVTYLARSLAPSSIQNYINIIRILHEDNDLPNPMAKNFELSNLLKGIARLNGSPPKQMLPMTCEILWSIKLKLDFANPADVSFWAICTTGFFGFLRKASMLPKAMKNHGTDCLLRSDVVINNIKKCTVIVRKTKTIQCGERVLKIPYCADPGQPLCPVTALFKLFTVAPQDPNLPLFSYLHEGGWSCWTQERFVSRLRELLSKTGIDAKQYSGHSFRRGGASLGFRLGMSICEIKQRGDWQSDAVEKYIVLDDEQEFHVAKRLVLGASSLLI